MKIPGCFRAFCSALGLGLATASAVAQSGSFAALNKSVSGLQTGPTTAQPVANNAYSFNASLDGTATTPVGPRNFVIPGGGTRTLTFDGNDQQWIFEADFASQAALDAVFANGSYTFNFGGRSVVLPYAGDLYPAIPVAALSGGTWNNNTVTVDRTQPLTITTAFSQNYLAGSSRLAIYISGGPNGQVNLEASSSDSFNQSQIALTVPANTFQPGINYRVELEANRIVTMDTTSAPGYAVVSLYSARNSFSVTASQSGPPVFIRQPATHQISNNSTVVFTALATNATSYQWRRNDVPIVGAVRPSLVIFGATNANAGSYSVVASNATDSVTSIAANLNIAVGNDFGRLSNLSILTDLTATTTDFTMGTVIGGANTLGTKPLLIRAVGPSLSQLIGAGALPDSRLELYADQTVVASNDDWLGAPALANVFAQVGAFGFTGPDSKDAAIFNTLAPRAGGYTVRVSGAPGATGRVIAELYDATSITAFPPPTPRLINVSVRKQIDAGTSLTAGFVIAGSTAKTVLVRAIGPGLAPFGVPGFMADPRLELFNSSSVPIAANDNWGGDPQLTQAGTRVGAFVINPPTSADAMLLLTLAPGNYSAEVRGVTGGGNALVEVYEVP